MNCMPRFAVAILYQKIPKYDRVILDHGKTLRYFQGDVEVMNCDAGVILTPELGLDLEFVEAGSAEEAMKDMMDHFGSHILRVTAREVVNDR